MDRGREQIESTIIMIILSSRPIDRRSCTHYKFMYRLRPLPPTFLFGGFGVWMLAGLDSVSLADFTGFGGISWLWMIEGIFDGMMVLEARRLGSAPGRGFT